MKFHPIEELPEDKVKEFFVGRWGSSQMVISNGIYECSDLDGCALLDEAQEIIGLVTYTFHGSDCEITSLDSLEVGRGIGTALIKEVEKAARENGCRRIRLTTTNDNINALRFYQKRGFVLFRLIPNAIEKSREIKPEIPLIGNYGIPIRDEIELIKDLDA
jgi:ribosomal protein S18 acetylase RimI-like enzyme